MKPLELFNLLSSELSTGKPVRFPIALYTQFSTALQERFSEFSITTQPGPADSLLVSLSRKAFSSTSALPTPSEPTEPTEHPRRASPGHASRQLSLRKQFTEAQTLLLSNTRDSVTFSFSDTFSAVRASKNFYNWPGRSPLISAKLRGQEFILVRASEIKPTMTFTTDL